MGFTLVYLITPLLGQDPLGEKLRPFFESPRHHARHGTRKVLSVLSMALYLLADPRWAQRRRQRLAEILARLTPGCGVACLPPYLLALSQKLGEGKLRRRADFRPAGKTSQPPRFQLPAMEGVASASAECGHHNRDEERECT
jgi:hypothetical protein